MSAEEGRSAARWRKRIPRPPCPARRAGTQPCSVAAAAAKPRTDATAAPSLDDVDKAVEREHRGGEVNGKMEEEDPAAAMPCSPCRRPAALRHRAPWRQSPSAPLAVQPVNIPIAGMCV